MTKIPLTFRGKIIGYAEIEFDIDNGAINIINAVVEEEIFPDHGHYSIAKEQ